VSQNGVVIAMNPNTGEILAMVSYPAYDDSRFARYDLREGDDRRSIDSRR